GIAATGPPFVRRTAAAIAGCHRSGRRPVAGRRQPGRRRPAGAGTRATGWRGAGCRVAPEPARARRRSIRPECTPLHLAATHAQGELLRALLALGCDPNTRDCDQRTPLFAALEHGATALPLVRHLIAHGADPEAADTHGETPLGLALEHPVLERWLDWRDWPLPHSPLRAEDLPAAAATGALGAVQRLLELGFAVDTRDEQG